VVLRDVASWFVQMENKFIPTGNKDSRLGIAEMEKLLPQMLADRFPNNERVAQNSGKMKERSFRLEDTRAHVYV
ncbi:MAG: hypothetical protein ABF313_09810, partial [Marivita sp.]